jgi:hypothetical protein
LIDLLPIFIGQLTKKACKANRTSCEPAPSKAIQKIEIKIKVKLYETAASTKNFRDRAAFRRENKSCFPCDYDPPSD